MVSVDLGVSVETDCSSYCLVISAGGDLAWSLLSKCPSHNKKMLDNRCDGNEYLSRQYQSGKSILMQDAVILPFLGNLPLRFHLSPLVVSRKIFSMEHLGTSQDEACGVRVGPGCISSLFSPNFLSVITRAGVQAAGRARLPDQIEH